MQEKYIEKEWQRVLKAEEQIRKISDYAAIKYKRRFFEQKRIQ